MSEIHRIICPNCRGRMLSGGRMVTSDNRIIEKFNCTFCQKPYGSEICYISFELNTIGMWVEIDHAFTIEFGKWYFRSSHTKYRKMVEVTTNVPDKFIKASRENIYWLDGPPKLSLPRSENMHIYYFQFINQMINFSRLKRMTSFT